MDFAAFFEMLRKEFALPNDLHYKRVIDHLIKIQIVHNLTVSNLRDGIVHPSLANFSSFRPLNGKFDANNYFFLDLIFKNVYLFFLLSLKIHSF